MIVGVQVVHQTPLSNTHVSKWGFFIRLTTFAKKLKIRYNSPTVTSTV